MTIQKSLLTIALVSACFIIQSPPLLAQNDQDSFKPPQEIDGSRLAPGATPPQSQPMGDNLQAFDRLFREIDNLIPGEFEPGSSQKKAVEDAITAFQLGNATRVIEIFKQLAADSQSPPPDVLLAGLSYATNDVKTGHLLLERASRENPDNVAVYSAFARLALNQHRTTDAMVLFEKMNDLVKQKTLPPESLDFYQTQYLDGMIEVAITQKRLGDARELLSQQREIRPNHPKVLLVSAELEFKEDNIDRCIEYLNQLKEKFPATRPPEAIIASWYQRTGNAEQAEKWVKDAAAKYASDTRVQLEYASWSLNNEDFPTASASIKKAESADKESPFSKSLKAKIAFARQSYLIAEAHYQSLVAMEPGNFDAANMYALCLIESSDPAKRQQAREIAMQNYRKLPNNAVAIAALGYIQLRLGEIEQAKAILTRVAQVGNTSSEIDFFVASYLVATHDNAKAKQFLDRALKSENLFLYRSAAKKILADMPESPSPANGAQPADDK